MKTSATIHKIENLGNRTNVTFNVSGEHNELATLLNKITAIERKYNAQSNIYSNKSSLVFDKKGDLIGTAIGNSGGTITFHSHSCNHEEAAKELENLLNSVGNEN